MTRSELIQILAARSPGLTASDVSAAVKVLLGAMADSLEAGERIEIRGFAAFSTHLRKPRVARNPKTGERVEVPAKRAVHFKPGRELRERVAFNCQATLADSQSLQVAAPFSPHSRTHQRETAIAD